MKNSILKLFLTISFISFFILSGFFSLFFSLNEKAIAQAPTPITEEVTVVTGGYSILGPSAVIFGGYYSGNSQGRGFTTYFQYKKNNSNLDSNTEETIKIVREANVAASADFYSSPELNLFSTYYFRAVGYFNNNPAQKFYGGVLSLRTGDIPIGFRYPYTVGRDGVAVNCVSVVKNVCKKDETGGGGGGGGGGGDGGGGIVGNDNTNSDNDNLGPTGLVPCVNNCEFNDILKLINKVVNFLFLKMVVPLAAIMFAYAGFELVTSGGATEKKEKAKKIFTNVALGLIAAAAAFLIIQTVLSIVGARMDVGINWFGF